MALSHWFPFNMEMEEISAANLELLVLVSGRFQGFGDSQDLSPRGGGVTRQRTRAHTQESARARTYRLTLRIM